MKKKKKRKGEGREKKEKRIEEVDSTASSERRYCDPDFHP
jgi:hypothetical protein